VAGAFFRTASLGRLTYLRSHTANSSSSTTGREYLLDRRRNGRRTSRYVTGSSMKSQGDLR
jgi:hypothetical protein